MPIVVGHGGGFGNAGAIIADQLGQDRRQAAAIAAKKSMAAKELQTRGAIASAQAQMRYEAAREANKTAIARAAIGANLQEDMQREEYMQGIQEAKQKAKDDAAKFDQKFTAEQRVKDARLNKAKIAIQESESLTDDQKAEALQRLDVAIATNSNPTTVLGDPNAKSPEEGKEPGKVWAGATDGSWRQGYYTTDTETGMAKLLVRPDQTPEFHEEKRRIEQEEAFNKLQLERENTERESAASNRAAREETRVKFMGDLFKENMKAEEGKGLSAGAMMEQTRKYMELVDGPPEPDTFVSGLQQEVTDLLGTARERYGSYDAIPDEVKARAVDVVRERYGAPEAGQGGGSESMQWLENARRQYGSFNAIPEELRKEAAMHARRVQAMRGR